MQPISPEHRAYVEDKAPDFARAVATLRQPLAGSPARKHRDPRRPAPAIHADLEEFDGDAFLLYACLWYAQTEGVALTFTPGGRE